MDRAYRVHRVGKGLGKGEGGKNEDDDISTCCQHLMRRLDWFAQEHAGPDHILLLAPTASAGLAAASLSAATRAVTLAFGFDEWSFGPHHPGLLALLALVSPQPICVSVARTHRVSPILLAARENVQSAKHHSRPRYRASSAVMRRSLSQALERYRRGAPRYLLAKNPGCGSFRSPPRAHSWFFSRLAIPRWRHYADRFSRIISRPVNWSSSKWRCSCSLLRLW